MYAGTQTIFEIKLITIIITIIKITIIIILITIIKITIIIILIIPAMMQVCNGTYIQRIGI